MDLPEYLRILKRRAWIPALLVVVTTAMVGAYSFLAKPQYVATASVVAKTGNTSNNSSTLSFPEIAASNSLALQVIQGLDLNMSADQLLNRIQVTSGRSNLYKISVTDDDPKRATNVANAFAQGAARLYQDLGSGAKTSITQQLENDQTSYFQKYYVKAAAVIQFKAQHPDAATSMDPSVAARYLQLQLDEKAAANVYSNAATASSNARVQQLNSARDFEATVVDQAVAKPDFSAQYLRVVYGAGIAFAVGLALMFALELIDDSLRDPEDVEELIDVPVIGVIPLANTRLLRTDQQALP